MLISGKDLLNDIITSPQQAPHMLFGPAYEMSLTPMSSRVPFGMYPKT